MAIDVDAVRAGLQAEHAGLIEALGDLTTVNRDPAATIGFGKRVGEGTSQAVDRIEKVGQADALAAKLADVTRALAKLDEGTYGRCDRCGNEIGEGRLEARAWSVLCVTCASLEA
ncbi:MAG: TraR/DksA C4-type zinc finger protein [Actinomycetota bacterium]